MSALISVAAHLEGKHCTSLDLTGIAVKNGAVSGHIRICNDSERLHGARISAGGADLLIGCDMIVASNREMMSKYDNTRTSAVLNEHVAPTYAFQVRPDLDLNTARMKRDLLEAIGAERAVFVDANRLVSGLIGDTMLTNIFILGFTLQRGLLPVSVDALERAVELNGVSIDANKRALNLGRLAAYDAPALEHAIGARDSAEHADRQPETLDQIIEFQVEHLAAYQNDAYAARYRALVNRVADAERAVLPSQDDLARAVARYYAKLLAYKDEYEVARLYGRSGYWQALAQEFAGDYKLRLHLAPPLFAKRHPVTGEIEKREFGPWIWPLLRLMARVRFLRGGRFDIFGRTDERKMERGLIADYEALVNELISGLTTDNHQSAIELAALPEHIRGFGHVKARHVEQAKAREGELLVKFRDATAVVMQAAS